MTRNAINKTAPAYDISLNTPIALPITSADFDKYLNAIQPALFKSQEAFTYIHLVDASTSVITVVYDLIFESGNVAMTLPFRVGSLLPCRAVRILTGTDPSAIITVGVGN